MPCPRTQQANLPACSPQPPLNAERQAGKLRMPFFKVFWYDSTRGMNPRSTDCEADALTTMPSPRDYATMPMPSPHAKLHLGVASDFRGVKANVRTQVQKELSFICTR